MDFESSKEFGLICLKCYGIGHKVSECSYTTGKPLVCAFCGGKHHPRDCFRGKKGKSTSTAIEDAQDPVETPAPAMTTETTTTVRVGRNDREKNARKANIDIKKRFRNLGKSAKDNAGTTNDEDEPAPSAMP